MRGRGSDVSDGLSNTQETPTRHPSDSKVVRVGGRGTNVHHPWVIYTRLTPSSENPTSSPQYLSPHSSLTYQKLLELLVGLRPKYDPVVSCHPRETQLLTTSHYFSKVSLRDQRDSTDRPPFSEQGRVCRMVRNTTHDVCTTIYTS